MTTAVPFPWHALPRVSRSLVSELSAARRALGPVSLDELGQAIGSLAQGYVDLHATWPPDRSPVAPDAVIVENGEGTLRWALRPENALTVALLGRVLGRPETVPLVDRAELVEPLRGAIAAVALEALRRAGLAQPLLLSDTPATGDWTHFRVTLRIDGRPYALDAWLATRDVALSRPHPRPRAMPALPVTLTAVAAQSQGRLLELASLTPGDGWFPGASAWWVEAGDGRLAGRVALCATDAERGVWAECSEAGRIVLTAEGAVLDSAPAAGGGETPDMNEPDDTLANRVLDAPVVVRVEVATLTLTARQWAELAPGDVVETREPLGGTVTLRAAGREIARGELVSVDGELGVRVLELVQNGRE